MHERIFAACAELMLAIHRLPVPVVARVQGLATAAGCQLVAACDLAVAAEGARFATPGVKTGLFCTTPMVEVARAVGRKRAMEMLLTGDPIDAPTALDWGLVNRVVPADRLDEEAAALAGRVATASRATVAIGKRAFGENLDLPLEEAYRHASGGHVPERRDRRRAGGHRRLPGEARGDLVPPRMRGGGPAHAQLEAILACVSGGVAVADAGGRVLEANERWCEIVGQARGEIVGRPWDAALHSDGRGLTAVAGIRRRRGPPRCASSGPAARCGGPS